MRLNRFARFAWFVVAYNLAVILWGAYVRASVSGNGCGSHWPLCNGEVIPTAPQLKTLVEFSHRLTSGLSVVLLVGLAVWAWRAYPKG
ncbi:MAG TPA: COX15/CtaA family protein, partial [Pyrinomonadaceae bacterium]|nr:COX15/CtaA family protein [Pyrinomonadaceae bacterium]